MCSQYNRKDPCQMFASLLDNHCPNVCIINEQPLPNYIITGQLPAQMFALSLVSPCSNAPINTGQPPAEMFTLLLNSHCPDVQIITGQPSAQMYTLLLDKHILKLDIITGQLPCPNVHLLQDSTPVVATF